MHLSVTSVASGSRLAARAAAGLAGLAVLFGAGSARAQAATVCPQDAGAALPAMSGTQSSCWKPFTSTSPFNTALPSSPKLAADSAAVTRHMSAYHWHVNGSTTGFSLSDNGTRPVYFATDSDPVITVHCKGVYGPTSCQGASGVNVDGVRVHIPAGARPTANGDGHLAIVETDTGDEYDFWHATVSGAAITADTGVVENVNDSNGTNDGGDAASLALTAGLLRPSELASGRIDHALVISIPCVNANGADVGWVFPASGGWGEPCGQYWNETTAGAPPIGSLFKLNLTDAQIAASGAPKWEQTIMTALAHYGAYAEDTNGGWHDQSMVIFTQDATSWTSLGEGDQWASTIRQLGGVDKTLSSNVAIPVNKLEVVDPCVVQGTCPDASSNDPSATTSTVKPPKKAPKKAPKATATSLHRSKTRAGRHRRTVHQRRGAIRPSRHHRAQAAQTICRAVGRLLSGGWRTRL
jgi:hypothetical protein